MAAQARRSIAPTATCGSHRLTPHAFREDFHGHDHDRQGFATTSPNASATRRWSGCGAITEGCVATVVAKMENFNPLWSVKDRIGRAMIDAAERDGKIKQRHRHHRADQRQHRHRPGVRLRGPRLQADGDDAREHEPGAPPAAQGARAPRLVLTPAAEGHAGRRSARPRSWSRRTTNYFMPQQFKNPANPGDPPQDDRRGNLARHRRQGRHPRLRRRHRRHDHRRGRSAQAAQARRSRSIAVEPVNSPVITQTQAGRAAQAGPAHDPGHRRRLHPRRAERRHHRRSRAGARTKTPSRPPAGWPSKKA